MIFKILVFVFLFLSSVIAEEYNQQDVDTFYLIQEMLEKSKKGQNFSKEIKMLEEQDFSPTLKRMLSGVKSYNVNNYIFAREFFMTVKPENPYFELMNKVWYNCVYNSSPPDLKAFDQLSINKYDTHLRDSVNLEVSCELGLEEHYEKLMKSNPDKLREFEAWRRTKAEKFDRETPGNWYLKYGILDRGIHKLAAANEVVENQLLGFSISNDLFQEKWIKIHSLRPDLYKRSSYLSWTSNFFYDYSSILEEVRSHVLLGHFEIAEKNLNQIKLLMNDSLKGRTKDYIKAYCALNSEYYYLKGLNLFLRGENNLMKGAEAKQDLFGEQGATVQLHLSAVRYGKNDWAIKAKKLYEYIQAHSNEWFAESIKSLSK